MRTLLLASMVILATGSLSAQAPAPQTPGPQAPGLSGSAPLPATDVTSKQMEDFIDKLPKDAISDLPVKTVDVGGSRIGIYGVFRPQSQPGDAIAHETRTSEVYVILEGAGTLVTGGTIAGTKPPPAGRNPGPRGERIDGGVTRRVSKGDVIVIPGRTPHWWSALESDIRYMIVRSDPDNRLTLR